jgi:hypothetical protein
VKVKVFKLALGYIDGVDIGIFRPKSSIISTMIDDFNLTSDLPL